MNIRSDWSYDQMFITSVDEKFGKLRKINGLLEIYLLNTVKFMHENFTHPTTLDPAHRKITNPNQEASKLQRFDLPSFISIPRQEICLWHNYVGRETVKYTSHYNIMSQCLEISSRELRGMNERGPQLPFLFVYINM